MKQIKLGIDNGNYNTKSSEHLLYASGFTMSDREFITNDMQLFYNGVYYAIGGKRMSFQQDKTQEPDSFILSLPTIAHAMKQAETTEAEIILGVGLPIDIFGAQKQAFRNYFLRGDVTFEFEGVLYHSHIAECKVFAQGYALRERGIDLKLPTVFSGGGAELLGSRLIAPGVAMVDILDRFANADGYKLLLGQ